MSASGHDRDWYEWHRAYGVPGSALAVRLGLVTSHVRMALDEVRAGPIQVISLCAGQGRDLIGALVDHPRRADVRATLVELDERNVTVARELVDAADLSPVTVMAADASKSDTYIGSAPADVVLACGIFGNIPDSDIRRTIELLPMLLKHGATVIWTRHRRPPDLTGAVRIWFAGAGYDEIAFDVPEDLPIGVGVHRWRGEDGVVEEGVGFFEFVEGEAGA